MPTFQPTTDVMKKLVKLFNDNPDFKTDFDQSFTLARSVPLSEWTDLKINDVDDYLRYMEEYLHWVPIENGSATKNGTNVYMHICMFYFVIDMPPVLKYQNAIDPNTKAPYLQLSEWLIEYAKEMGRWMDTTDSFNKDTLKTFQDSRNYRMGDYIDDHWTTFNEFFARRIRPELRPFPVPNGDNVIVAPADCKYDGQWPVSEASTVEFSVKGVPWHISQLLYDETTGKDWAPHFAGGTFTHSFLAPDNYHRQHAPVSGKIVEAKVVPGLCYLEVVLKHDENKRSGTPRLGMHRHIRSKREHHIVGHVVPPPVRSTSDGNIVDAPDSPGYQFLQARGLVIMESAIGLVAVLPIGMAQVSSVVLSDKVKKAVAPGATEADKWITKGEEISKFQLGGSDIVMVFQKGANVQLPGPDKINSPYKVHEFFGTGTVINDIKPPQ